MAKPKILLVRKMSALEYYYHGNHSNQLVNEGHANHSRSISEIETILRSSKIEFDTVTRKELSEDLIQGYDAVIAAGGDGTVIAVAAYNKDKPQLNLRTDVHSIGALCQKNIPEALKYFLAEDYHTEIWTRQDVYLNGKFIGRASNETCIGERLRFDKLAKYDLTLSDFETGLIKKESQSSSGLIVVTGTGSTAWPAAFKPFPKESSYFEFRNLLMHSGSIEKGKISKIVIDYKGHEGKFAIDTLEFDFPKDSQLEIEVSKHYLPVIIPNTRGN